MKNCSRPILQSKLLEFSKKAWNQGSFLQKGCFISNLSRKSPFPENCHSRLCQWHPAIQFPCLMTILSITVRTLEPELSPRGPAGGIRAPTCNLGGIPYVELRGGVSQTNPRSHQLTSWVYQVNINSLCSISPESHQNLPCFFGCQLIHQNQRWHVSSKKRTMEHSQSLAKKAPIKFTSNLTLPP